MKKFTLTFRVVAIGKVEVDAENREEAMVLAEEEIYRVGSPCLDDAQFFDLDLTVQSIEEVEQ